MKTNIRELDNQIAFKLYINSKKMNNVYMNIGLKDLGLTYTQYLTMTVLWQEKKLTVKELGTFLTLDSGTMTPLLKKLEKHGYINRKRSLEDERVVIITLTKKGDSLQENINNLKFEEFNKNLKKLTKVDIKKLNDLLDKLNDSMESE
jgi:DNA-binding MarR family transcriptional regulator